MIRLLHRDQSMSKCEINFEALDLPSNNSNRRTTYFLILHANEGDEWPANFEFGHSDPSPATAKVAQNAGSKSSARPINWGAICPIEIGRNLAELYIKIKEICHSVRILWYK